MAPVRLYVGGLPAGVTEQELRQRFTPFGEVTAVSIAPPKMYGPDASFPRNFGHVELVPKDEAALRKGISAYNGCRWKGSVLKCAPARRHYTERLAEEQVAKAAGGGGGTLAATQVRLQQAGCWSRVTSPEPESNQRRCC